MIKAIVCDIEGTTTSVSFVYDTLFPYFVEHIQSLETLQKDESVARCIRNIQDIVRQESGKELDFDGVILTLKQWVKDDRKEGNLKLLQGLIWRKAYEQGAIKGHLYADVEPNFVHWTSKGIKLYIYSSGSVEAQKLLFKYSENGDLSPFISGYFDTTIGPKRESESYCNIVEQLAMPPKQILFLSDIEAELDAAKTAGIHTTQLVRPGTRPGSKHPQASSFDTIEAP